MTSKTMNQPDFVNRRISYHATLAAVRYPRLPRLLTLPDVSLSHRNTWAMPGSSSEPSTSRPRGYGTSSSSSPTRSSKGKQSETVIDIDSDAAGQDSKSHRMNGNTVDRKGKGKARDDAASMPAGLSVNVRFTDGTTEDLVDLFVNDSETVRMVKKRVRPHVSRYPGPC